MAANLSQYGRADGRPIDDGKWAGNAATLGSAHTLNAFIVLLIAHKRALRPGMLRRAPR